MYVLRLINLQIVKMASNMDDESVQIVSTEESVATEEIIPPSNEAQPDSSKQQQIKYTKLPLSKIKSIMKMDPDVSLASNEAVVAVTKATELFLESIAKEAYTYTAKGKRKTVTKKDLDNVIDTVDCLSFLEGALDF